MPMVEVEGQQFEFPDGTPDNIIGESIREYYASQDQQQQPLTREQLLTGGALPGVALTDEDISTIRGGGKISPVKTMPESASKIKLMDIPEPGTQVESFGAGVKRGVEAIGTGGAKLLSWMSGDKVLSKKLEVASTTNDIINAAVGRDYPWTNLAGEITGEIVALPIPGAAGKTVTTKIVSVAAAGAGASAISAAGRGEDVLNAALLGAGIGTGIAGLTEAGKKLFIKYLNASGGKFMSKDIQDLVEFSEANKLPIFVDDLSASPFLKKMGVAAEDIPVIGTLGGRKLQSERQKEFTGGFVDYMSDGVEDYYVEAQKGMQNKLKKLRAIRKDMFDRVAAKLDPMGYVPLKKFRDVAQEQINKEVKEGTRANKKTIAILESFRDAPSGNFSTLNNLRNDITDEVSKYYKGENAAIGARGVDKLQILKKSMDEVFEIFAKKDPKAARLYKQAMRFSRDKITKPFKKSALKKLVNTDQPEKVISMMTSGATKKTKGIKSKADLWYNALDPKGRKAVRAAILNEAYNNAMVGKEVFSANTFAGEIEKLENITGKFFKGQDKKMLNGLIKYLRATGRAGQVMENPPNGLRLLIPGTGLGMLLGQAAKIVGGAVVLGLSMKTLLQTKIGRKALLGLGESTPGTKKWEKWIDRLSNLAKRSLITAGQTQ